MTVSAYVNRMNNTPSIEQHTPATAPSVCLRRNQQNVPKISREHTPVLMQRRTRENVPAISLSSQSRQNLMVDSILPSVNEPSTEQPDDSPPRRPLTRLSMRRTHDEKQDIRARLLASIVEAKNSDTTANSKQKRKLIEPGTANTSIVSEDSFNDTANSPKPKLKRSSSVKKACTIQRRASTRLAKPRQL
jgi:hypothetical protein